MLPVLLLADWVKSLMKKIKEKSQNNAVGGGALPSAIYHHTMTIHCMMTQYIVIYCVVIQNIVIVL